MKDQIAIVFFYGLLDLLSRKLGDLDTLSSEEKGVSNGQKMPIFPFIS